MEQLSGLDAAFLYLETPQMHMHVALCAVMEGDTIPEGERFGGVESLIRDRLHLLPPFRRKLFEDPLGLDHPYWVDDPDFDLLHHMRHVRCAAPGGPKELGDLVGRINSRALPRDRPLWELWVIEGLEKNRFAIVAKVHHCAVDGMMGAGMMVHLFSMQPDAPAPPPPPATEDEAVPSDLEMLRGAAMTRLSQPRRLLELARRTAQRVGEVLERRRDPDEPFKGAVPLTAPRTRFNHTIGAQRDVAFARLPLAGLKAIKHRHEGAKLNDVILAVVAGALRRYLTRHGDLPAVPLVATCPVATSRARGSNQVSAMWVPLPTHLDDPTERMRAIRASSRGAKADHQMLGGGELLGDWAELAPSTTMHLATNFYTRLKLAEHHRPFHNLVVSNVPGPPFPIYLAGAKLVAAYPMGPVMDGAGLNVTVMSYCNDVDVGFMVARSAMPDVWQLCEDLQASYDELDAAGATPEVLVRESP